MIPRLLRLVFLIAVPVIACFSLNAACLGDDDDDDRIIVPVDPDTTPKLKIETSPTTVMIAPGDSGQVLAYPTQRAHVDWIRWQVFGNGDGVTMTVEPETTRTDTVTVSAVVDASASDGDRYYEMWAFGFQDDTVDSVNALSQTLTVRVGQPLADYRFILSENYFEMLRGENAQFVSEVDVIRVGGFAEAILMEFVGATCSILGSAFGGYDPNPADTTTTLTLSLASSPVNAAGDCAVKVRGSSVLTNEPYELEIDIHVSNWGVSTDQVSGALNAVAAVDATTFVAVGDQGALMRTTDGGQRWFVEDSSTNANLVDVAFASASVGVAVGSNGTIVRTNNGGASWAVVSGVVEPLNGVAFGTTTVGLIAGDNGTLLVTDDGGATWASRASGTSEDLLDCDMVGGAFALVVPAVGDLLASVDFAQTWSTTPGPSGVGNESVDAISSDDIWVGGIELYVTNDGGQTWSERYNSPATERVADISAWDTTTILAVIWQPQGGVFEGTRIIRSSDGGATWEEPYEAFNDFTGILATGTETAFAVGGAQILVRDGPD